LRHFASSRFWRCFDALPADIQDLARRNYTLLKQNPAHPSLRFKSVHGGHFRSVRVGIHYRALGVPVYPDDFDAPLPDAVLAQFEGRGAN